MVTLEEGEAFHNLLKALANLVWLMKSIESGGLHQHLCLQIAEDFVNCEFQQMKPQASVH
jgi:hypothetical protein